MLTQSEIDALLSGTIDIEGKGGAQGVNLADLMNSSTEHQGPESEKKKKIQAYNFWSPDRFSKEQMRAVELIHEDLAERLTTSMPTPRPETFVTFSAVENPASKISCCRSLFDSC